jgi:adenylate cyclase
MFTFRTSITCAVMAFILALAALLIAIQVRSLRLATREAAAAYMDATSSKVFGRLQSERSTIVSLVRVLAASSSVADSDQLTETSGAVPLFKAALREMPQMDSIYVGSENGAWLQVRRLNELNDEQRSRLRATPGSDVAISSVRPTGDELPMRRVFEDKQGNEIGQFDLWKYGYDARTRSWYRDTKTTRTLLVSSPYLAFSIGSPVITVSAPLQGNVNGVLAADLKLDSFSDFVQEQRPGQHGIVWIFDTVGSLLAHPDFAQFVNDALTHPSRSQLPNVDDISSGVAAAVLKSWPGGDPYDGEITDAQGRDYLFRLAQFNLGKQYYVSVLLLAAQDDFVQGVRRLQVTGLILAIAAGCAFVPAVWLFGSRMSRSLKTITAQAARLQTLAAPDPSPVTSSFVREIHELGQTVSLAQRAIWSFARFVPKEIVRRVIDNSISTELGGAREEITVLFTDVRDFTTIAESADPDLLMRQTSRYFSALTDAFLAEGGTVDKFIGDAVMVFWNAPNPQHDHVERACRAALAGRAASEKLNSQFEAEGLKPFFTRFGIHVGEAVVGNLGSTERMNYTALGDTVNLASRLEGLNKQFGTAILVSEGVYARVQDRFLFKAVGSVTAKGMTRETRVFELVGAAA